MTKAQAIALGESKFWQGMSDRAIAEFQLMEDRFCIPFDIYQGAMERTLGRPVYTHEFSLNVEGLKAELFDGKDPPTLEEILNLIPENKRIIVLATEE